MHKPHGTTCFLTVPLPKLTHQSMTNVIKSISVNIQKSGKTAGPCQCIYEQSGLTYS